MEKLEHRVTVVEEGLKSLDDKVTEIKDNHLVHLKIDIERVGAKQDKAFWFIMSTLVSIVVGLLWIIIK